MNSAIKQNDRLNDQRKLQKSSSHLPVLYYALCAVALALISAVVWWAYLPIVSGFNRLPDFVNLSWAHEPLLLEALLSMLLMMWLVVSAFFWGGWLLSRSARKIKGQHWRSAVDVDAKGKLAAFFPPVLCYLKLSCYYLIFVFVFVTLQYPLQYLLF